MAVEVEKKFLVDKKNFEWRESECNEIQQGYLHNDKKYNVRVRIKDQQAFLTIKSKTDDPTVRNEYEYEIPRVEALTLLKLCDQLIMKKRYEYNYRGHIWEIDEFLGDNEGLIVAEFEYKDRDVEPDLPSFIRREVTDDPRYLNSSLVKNPYKNWKVI